MNCLNLGRLSGRGADQVQRPPLGIFLPPIFEPGFPVGLGGQQRACGQQEGRQSDQQTRRAIFDLHLGFSSGEAREVGVFVEGDCPNFRGHRPGTDAKRWSALVDENGTVPFDAASGAKRSGQPDRSKRRPAL